LCYNTAPTRIRKFCMRLPELTPFQSRQLQLSISKNVTIFKSLSDQMEYASVTETKGCLLGKGALLELAQKHNLVNPFVEEHLHAA